MSNLGDCNIGDEGAKHLSKGDWPKLKLLGICKKCLLLVDMNKIGVEGMMFIANSWWTKLNKIDFNELPPVAIWNLVSTNWN